MTTGLVLGKFAPLHRGHQMLIERALAQTDRVVVVVYDAPETTSVPLPVRAGWIKKIYPSVEVLEAWDGPTVVGNTPEIMVIHEVFLLKLLGDRKISHFFSSEFYGDHVSRALGAVDCRVDETRSRVPISGTAIRANLFENRRFIPNDVYRDLVTKIVFLGAPSTGKTSLAEALAKKMNTVWMPEYGRAYWETHQQNRRLTAKQLVEIADEHIHIEDKKILDANRYLFVDTDATTTFMFSQYYHGTAHPRLAKLADDARLRYDLFFLCGDDIPYADTWDRSGDANRTVMQKRIRADLLRRRVSFIDLAGSMSTRIDKVIEILQDFDKFDSVSNNLFKRLNPSPSSPTVT